MTAIGIALGLATCIITLGLAKAGILDLFNANVAILIIGGTLSSSFIAFHGRYVMRTLKALMSIVLPFHISPSSLLKDVALTIELAKIRTTQSMKEFRIALTTVDSNDDFIVHAQNLIATGYCEDTLGQMLEDAIDTHFERQMVQHTILKYMARMSPIIGFTASLIALAIHLNNPNDISTTGIVLPVVYGILISALVFIPATEKIRQRYEIIRFRNRLLKEGYVMLSKGEDPLAIQDKLNSYLDKTNRFKIANKSLSQTNL